MLSGTSTPRGDRRRVVGTRQVARESVGTLRSVDELDAFVRALPAHLGELRLVVEHLDLLRPLTLLPAEPTVDRVVLVVEDWERPLKGWTGRLGRLPHVLSCATSYPPDGEGEARLELELEKPTPLADVVRGAYTLLGVDRGQHGYSHVEVGTADDAPAAALGLLPSRTAKGLPDVPSHHLVGLGLSRADLGLVGTPETLEELRRDATDPELTLVSVPLLVDGSGHLAVTERREAPLLDLNVHNPIGRLHTFDRPRASIVLAVDGDRLRFEVVELPRRADDDTDDPGAHEQLVDWSRPVRASLSAQEVRRLRAVEAVDLSRLAPAGPEDETVLYRRLAELAATGVVLHSLPPSFARADDVLGPLLAGLLRSPYRACTGLVRELRTVPQRREAMQRFGGFFELARHAEQLGHRLLPTVSVVLSTMRPSRVTKVLLALAAQGYPHVEIALALHGVEGPLPPELEEAVRLSGATVSHHDAATPFGTVLAEAARRTHGDLVVKIDDDDVYGPRVVEDLVLAYLYSNADVVGKTTEFLYFEGIDHTAHRTFQTERYHYQVAGGAMMLSRAALHQIGGWRPSRHSTDRSVLIRVGNSGGVGYRTTSLGYVYIRHSDGHTWKQMDSMLLRNTPEQWPRFMHEIVEA